MKPVYCLVILAMSCKSMEHVTAQTAQPHTVIIQLYGKSNYAEVMRVLTKLAPVDITVEENNPFYDDAFYCTEKEIRAVYDELSETSLLTLRRELGKCHGILDVYVCD
jgi:hypothetical protein